MKKRIRFRFTFDSAKFSLKPRFSFDRSALQGFKLLTFDWFWFGAWANCETLAEAV